MKKLATRYNNNINLMVKKQDDEAIEVMKTLEILKDGYQKKDPTLANEYLKKLFLDDDSIYVLGTATEELCPGLEEVKDLLSSDWQYWGDVTYDLEQAIIQINGKTATFALPGNVKYTFEHTPSRYDNYVDFMNDAVNNESMNDEEKISFVNWAMALTYHQYNEDKRNYFCPLRLSGIMLKENDTWKIASCHFSMPQGVFPDQRLEADNEFIDDYNKDISMFKDFGNHGLNNQVKQTLEKLSNGISENKLDYMSVFSNHDDVHLISTETQWYVGKDSIQEYLESLSNMSIKFNYDTAIMNSFDNKFVLTGIGLVKRTATKETILKETVESIKNIHQSDLKSIDKLFHIHRQAAYAMKEISHGESYSYPIRFSVVLDQQEEAYLIDSLHLSYANNWIFEGKLDSVK